MERLTISLLGPFRVALDGNPVTQFEADTARALLAYLVMHVEIPHRRETLAGLLWPDLAESAALQDLRQALNRLRKAIGDREANPPFLHVSRQAIQFNRASDYWLDVSAFTNLINARRAHCHNLDTVCQLCMQRLQETAKVFRGDFLTGFSLGSTLFEEWLTVQRERFHHEAIDVFYRLTTCYETRGDYAQARQYTLRQLELEPWREEAHQQLMRVLALSGQRSAALTQYKTCCRILAKELGLAPSAETVALYQRIRAGDMQGHARTETLPSHASPARQEHRSTHHERTSRQRLRRLGAFGLLTNLFVMMILTLQSVFHLHRDDQLHQVILSSQLAVQALNHLDEQQFDLAALLSLEAYRLADTPEGRGSLMSVVSRTPYRAILRRHTRPISSLAFSPDGRRLVSGSDDGLIASWDAMTGELIGELAAAYEGAVSDVALSRTGILASNADRGTLTIWEVKSDRHIRPLLTQHSREIRSMAFSPDGQTLAVGNADSTIMLWDVTTGQPFGSPLIGHTGRVTSLAFSPDGQTLASGGKDVTWGSVDDTIILWDVATGHSTGHFSTDHVHNVTSVAFSPDGQTLGAGYDDGAIMLWDISSDQPARRTLTHTGQDQIRPGVPINVQVAFSPDGCLLASGGPDGAITIWDLATMQPRGDPRLRHKGGVTSLAFSPDGQTLASGGEDAAVILWVMGQAIGQSVRGHSDRIWSVAVSPDGRSLASGSDEGTIVLRNLVTPPSLDQPLIGHTAGVNDLTFSLDGKMLASGGDDGAIILWSLAADQPVGMRLNGHTGGVNSIDFSPDGRILASGGRDHMVMLWDVATRRPLEPPLAGHTDGVWSVAFSPNGQTLASGSWDGTVILWDVTTHRPLGPPLVGHTDAVVSVAFSPDGHMLASAGRDDTIVLWDVARAQPVGTRLSGHIDSVWSIAFSPDGQMLASASCSTLDIYEHCIRGEVRLWDGASGQPIGQPLVGHDGVVWDLAFGPDGQTLVSGGDDGAIILWNVSLEWWQASACAIASRNLTRDEWQQYLGSEPYHETCPN